MRSASLIVGRTPECDVRLDHRSVSARHAQVTPLADGRLEVVDLGSSNGTFVVEGDRRTRIRARTVEASAVLVFGAHRTTAAELLKVRAGGPGVAPGPRADAASAPLLRCSTCFKVKRSGAPCPHCGSATEVEP